MTKVLPTDIKNYNSSKMVEHGGAVGWGNAPQARRSRVRFPMASSEFFNDNLSSHTMAPGLTQPLKEMNTRNISWGVKAASA